ncbi:MAG: DUF1499 domain-containing protein [Kiloniellales bacterium]|nr:DUF1499 domain-containing protein [Kiloniellales bacterium]
MRHRLILIAIAIAILASLALPGSALAVKFGLVHWTEGLGFFAGVAPYLAIGAALLSIAALVASFFPPRRHRLLSLIALAFSAGMLAIPLQMRATAEALPFIHDITTDTADPPAFVAAVALRQPGENDIAYGGEEIAAQQRQGYPDLKSLQLALAPAQAFALALRTAEAMDWEIVAQAPEEGRIEAVATSFWFGFKDDVIVRLRPVGSGTRLDLRSASRVGQSDLGANAKRIRAYLEELQVSM